MPMHHQSKIALIIGLLLAIAGCATTKRMYEGPALPPEQTATIKWSVHYYVLSGSSTSIREVDGKDVPLGPGPIEVLPGEHEITCTVDLAIGYGGVTSPPQNLYFQAEAGHVYRVDGSFMNGHIWIVDETTGVEVASHRWEVPKSIEHEPF